MTAKSQARNASRSARGREGAETPSAANVFRLDPAALRPRLLKTYEELLGVHGRQGWWPGRHSFEVCAGAILVQNTAWTNARKALDNLQRGGADSVLGVLTLSEAKLADLIRPSGYYNQKAAKLAGFCDYVAQNYDADLGRFLSLPRDRLRAELLSLWGIGAETADSIILYAARQPSFVIDTYTVRFLERVGIIPSDVNRDQLRRAVMAALPEDVELYAEMHALIVQHGKRFCGTSPRCGDCPLIGSCDFGQSTGIIGARPAGRNVFDVDHWTGA